MANILIIGAGFSAALVHSQIKNSSIEVISPSNFFNKFIPKNIKNTEALKYNKLFGINAQSFSTLAIDSNARIKLHNRICWGGNSSIWGGFYDSDLDFNPIPDLNAIGANLTPLSIKNTGSFSNKASISQLIGRDGKIYNAGSYFTKIEDAYVTKIILSGNKVSAEIFSFENKKLSTRKYDKIYVCCGVFNSIALLVNSFSCKLFTLNDFRHKLTFCRMKSTFQNSDNNALIRYTFLRALNHFLGIQRKKTNLFNNFPFGIEQKFLNEKIQLNANVENNKLILSSLAEEFGSSIHYSNMYVDDTNLNKYIFKVSDKIRFFGMASVNQKNPGPISSDIHTDIYKYFNRNF